MCNTNPWKMIWHLKARIEALESMQLEGVPAGIIRGQHEVERSSPSRGGSTGGRGVILGS